MNCRDLAAIAYAGITGVERVNCHIFMVFSWLPCANRE